MAGSVTGSIGSNDVLLRNMATEETLYQILEALSNVTIEPGDPKKKVKADNEAAGAQTDNTKSVKKSTHAFDGFFKGMEGIGRVIHGLDSNINNASYAFQAMSRGTGVFSKTMELAASTVSQLQEQFNAYGKLMQVGGVMTSDFGDLSNQAVALGTDLQGLVKITTEYSQGMKAGSTSVASTLEGMRKQFGELSTNQIREYGRLGIGANQITEQMMLMAESQGGYNSVLARYGKDTKAMNAGMLKSTQELNVFASAVGMNSKLMQDEAAQAQKKIENRIFEATMTDEQRTQTRMFQALTGSYESAIQIMASLTGGPTSDLAGAFLSLKGITGMGKEIDNFMNAVKKGTDINKALTSSGMLEKVNNMSDAEFKQMQMNFRGYGADVQAVMGPLMQMMWSMRGTTEDTLQKKMLDFTKPLDNKIPKTIDSFSELLQEQNSLAKATAYLNSQFNRFGLTFALAGMKTVNGTINGGKVTKEMVTKIFGDMGIIIPDNIMSEFNDILEGKIQGDIVGKMQQFLESARDKAAKAVSGDTTGSAGVVTLRSRGIDANTAVPVKMAKGGIQHLNAKDLVENKNGIWSTTNALNGSNNNAGTVATGAMLAARIPTISAITAGSDQYHEGGDSKHNSGMALDFGLSKRAEDSSVAQTAEATIKAMHGLMKEYGLEADKDYRIDDESTKPTKPGTKWSGPHIHMEMLRPEAADKMRQIFQNSMKPADQQHGSNTKGLGDGTAVAQVQEDTSIKVTQATTRSLVNSDDNNYNNNDILMAALQENTQELKNVGRLLDGTMREMLG